MTEWLKADDDIGCMVSPGVQFPQGDMAILSFQSFCIPIREFLLLGRKVSWKGTPNKCTEQTFTGEKSAGEKSVGEKSAREKSAEPKSARGKSPGAKSPEPNINIRDVCRTKTGPNNQL